MRLFAQGKDVEPKLLNSHLETQGLNEYSYISGIGIEVDYPALTFFDLGIKATTFYDRVNEVAEPSANPDNPYYSSIQQSSLSLVGRLSLIETDLLRVESFGTIGAARTKVDIRTAAAEGKMYRGEKDWSSPVSSYGVSVALGWSKFYIYVDAGIEHNRVDKLKHKGTTPSFVTEVNLSGTFMAVGLLFNGFPGLGG